ncbi:hypothetical protein AVENLUH5627_02711 [Acinetobacter venetianus]|uniref:Uncharacterized protein n=1 Tax=Acinetobacter venetianus TaxID=52133 RepID=A0A150HME6_9GAMM|nr:hypothetical protein [Acinetobacter venetianus]KXZ65981.1 hypothetical protein AVENLUH5627_02711 [Acinetobacter venetianus]
MHPYYIKKNGLYLRVQTTEHEEYQDYSDIDAIVTQQYVFLDDKDNAIKFLEKREADRFLVTRGRKLKGVEIKRE